MSAYPRTVSPKKITNGQRSEHSPTKGGLPNELVQILNDMKSKGRNQRDQDGPRKVDAK